jgi:arabinofuranosyltransferase
MDPMVWLSATTALGVYGYCLYVVMIGGDYMIGRFWALPLFATVWLMYVFIPDNVRKDIPFCFACLLLITSLIPGQMKDIRGSCFTCVVGKAHMVDSSFTFRGNKLIANLYPLRLRNEGTYHLVHEGRRIAMSHSTQAHRMFYVGMSGFYAGSTVPLIDELALGDALLARLPASKRQNFYAGHFRRDIPKGYAYAIDTGSTERMDPNLAQYYKKLRLITSGDLFDPERLQTILYFNLGQYEHWKHDYLRNARR